jgi:hypothetical protein
VQAAEVNSMPDAIMRCIVSDIVGRMKFFALRIMPRSLI